MVSQSNHEQGRKRRFRGFEALLLKKVKPHHAGCGFGLGHINNWVPMYESRTCNCPVLFR